MANITKQERDALMLQWQPFIKKLARKYTLRDQELNDYINQGNIGLLLAIEKWDPDKGTFMTFGEYAARDQMRQYSRINQRIVSTPMETFSNVKKIRDLKEKGLNNNEIAKELSIKPLHVEMALNYEFGVQIEKQKLHSLNNSRERFVYEIQKNIKKIGSRLQQNIISLLLKGYNQKEISKILDIHKIYISQELTRIRESMKFNE